MKYLTMLSIALSSIQILANSEQNAFNKDSYDMQKEYLVITGKLSNIKKAENLEELQKIHKSIELFKKRADARQKLTQKQIRSLKLNLQLILLNTINNNLNSAFNPEDVPKLNIQPPRGCGFAMAGMSPNTIKDPKLRKEYEEAIRKNSEKAANYNFQTWLRRTKPNLLRELVEYINQNYSSHIQDTNEINQAIDALLADEKTRITIRKMIKESESH
ncbi:MAG: hypothetical protein BWY31_03881 [Lentisphaerae bacterium ADurb.Bin242]|nr:MAG: hypothetical protein BWY31_03881 [Lentisphaerae bacterium ADurb.Bin242]